MSSSGLWHDIKSNPVALIIAVGLHVVLITLLSMNLVSSEVHIQQRAPQKTIKAVAIDAAQFDREMEKLKQAEKKKQQKLKREQDKIKRQLAAEKKKLADLKKKKAALKKAEREKAKKKKQAAAKKAAAEKAALKKAALEKEVARKKAIADKKRAEQKKQAEIKKQKELKRQQAIREKELAAAAELKRKQELEAQRKRDEQELKRKLAEEERLEREAAEQARQAAAREKVLNRLRAQYVRMIEQKVERSWLKPVGVANISACEVFVTQSVLGDVLDVQLKSCTGDAVYLRSIESAVRRASPLPPPPDPGVFDKEIHFVFRPQA